MASAGCTTRGCTRRACCRRERKTPTWRQLRSARRSELVTQREPQAEHKRLRPFDVLTALNRLAASWPDVIEQEGKRSFRRSTVHAVLMACHRRYNWETFAIAVPVTYGRARPAHDMDLARETGLNPRTVGPIMQWLTD